MVLTMVRAANESKCLPVRASRCLAAMASCSTAVNRVSPAVTRPCSLRNAYVRILAGVPALLCSWVWLWLTPLSARRKCLLGNGLVSVEERAHFMGGNTVLGAVLRGASPMKLTHSLRSGTGLGDHGGEGVGGRTSSLLVSSLCMTEYGTVSPESVSEFAPSAPPTGSSSDSSSGSNSETWFGSS
ncbi:hypothetical protein L1987_13305 [Smallanthus sonchifolius]|uniref:Uncharacterized protein n=1 Tax=Smallanthus sonchifolius TaxID=185202 RepID=A0ACB9JH59_9ASTR|nr:hypothetical protein L1987_13305 [Smallanthus sonchifolius]